jgi:IS4 transposase
VFSDFASILIQQARSIAEVNPDLNFVSDNAVYAVDTTTIDLCLSVFWWAKFRKKKGAIKLHTQLDIKTEIPCFIHITDGKTHEVNVLDLLTYETGGFYIMDRGFVDYQRLSHIHENQAYFITRAKTNMNFRRVYSAKCDKKTGVRCDQTIVLVGYYSKKGYPQQIRRIKYFDCETQKTLIFLTNNFELNALQIALLYRYRWKIELFFKWIKQHLKVKSFWGHSENAVKVQVYCALITFLTVLIMKHKLKLKQSSYEILQILSITLLNKLHINQLFQDALLQDFKEQNCNQLNMF